MRVIETAEGEDAAANAIAVNGRVFLSAGHPGTAERLRRRVTGGGASHTQAALVDGGLSCMSLRYSRKEACMIRWLLDGPLKGFPDLPPVWLLGFMAAAWLHRPGPAAGGGLRAGLPVAGGLLMLAALGLIAWSALWFWRKKTTIEPHHTPTALIVEGPYRLSRNPIYLALLSFWWATCCAWGLWARDPSLRLYIVLTRRFIEPEEAGLRRLFGAEAHAYLERTRRWL
jgi:protein-S-isoprenylcysteine O-methyltransferase Ste14